MTRPPEALARLLHDQAVVSAFQPIVDLAAGCVVAYEALARGPAGPLARPAAMFAAARAQGRLAELELACQRAAFRGAVQLGLLAPLTLFVNVEPEVLDTAPLDDLQQIAASAPGELRVVVEITERALAVRPADLLRTVERVRSAGWGIALDDVGADPLSLAFMPLLCPDVVKLDLALVQGRPGPAAAEVAHAVHAYAERSGAVVLAEGIETEQHLHAALALGASLGQGWLFGRPERTPVPGTRSRLELPSPPAPSPPLQSPFDCLPADRALRVSPKPLLIEISRHLEREALRLGASSVVAATFQQARHLTPATRERYRALVEGAGFVCALGADLPAEPMPGLRGADLAVDDPVRGEWDITVLGPHFAAAMLARDLGDDGPERDRRFAFAITHDRDVVSRATRALLTRVVPQVAGGEAPSAPPTQRSTV